MSERPDRRRGPIDWAEARARLQQAEAAAQEAVHPSPGRARAIMDARARALAQPVLSATRGERLNVVLFGLGRERYAIDTRFLREVVRFADATPVPGTPEFIVGVTNLRGAVLVIVDLAQFLNVTSTRSSESPRVIVLGKERVEFGVLADQVHGQADILADEILMSRRSAPLESTFIRGVTKDALIVLDGAALLEDPRLAVDGDAQPGAFVRGE